MTTLLLYSSMPCENLPPVIYKLLNENCYLKEMKIGDTIDSKETIKIIDEIKPKYVIMMGEYWKGCLLELLKMYDDNINFIINSPRNIIQLPPKEPAVYIEKLEDGILVREIIKAAVEFEIGGAELNCLTPIEFVFQVLKITGKTSDDNYIKLLRNSNKECFKLLDDRFFSRNTQETQCFFSGLYNIGGLQNKLSFGDTFKNIILGEEGFLFEDVIKLGRVIAETQYKMALERAKKNSKIITLEVKDKKYKVALTNTNDLINLTHDALCEEFEKEGVDLTCIIGIKLDKKEYISYSYRTSNKEIDLNDFLNHLPSFTCDEMKGGKKTGGGRKEIDVKKIFF